jgi:hypothetical protein
MSSIASERWDQFDKLTAGRAVLIRYRNPWMCRIGIGSRRSRNSTSRGSSRTPHAAASIFAPPPLFRAPS